jgi:hypothetical protein
LVAPAVWRASSLISLATTAKPFPASPARAASMVAFRANRFTCSEMSVMVSTILPISRADCPSALIWPEEDSVCVTASDAMLRAFSVNWMVSDAEEKIDSPVSMSIA